MLYRQRVLLELLRVADRPVSHVELTKWSFLLRHETESSGGSAFYDFVPYQYGPFSFALYHELRKLSELSYVVEDDRSIAIGTESAAEKPLPRQVAEDLRSIVRRLGGYKRSKLIDYVYERYPFYTCNSVLSQLEQRPSAKPRVYSVGYEGCSVDSFLTVLVRSGITCLVDVRMNPVARRYGFHRSTLDRLCGKLGIEYRHFPDLGIRSERRKSLETEQDYEALFDEYVRSTLAAESDAVDAVGKLTIEKPSALMCVEADETLCHRSRLASEISRRIRKPIVHIRSRHA